MAKVKGVGTKPELTAIHELKSLGFKVGTHSATLPGKPDIILPHLKVVIFINGCFWHGHSCSDGKLPSSNKEYWSAKITRNKKRDNRVQRTLRLLGWHCYSIKTCKFSEDLGRVKRRLLTLRANYELTD